MNSLPLTKAFAGQPDLDALAEELNWLGGGVLVGQHPARAWEYGLAVRALQAWLSARSEIAMPHLILDVGGAGSNFGPILADKLWDTWEVETVDPKTNFTIEAWPYEPASVILCISTIEHVPDQANFLRALGANLRPGGLCFLTMDGKGDEGPDTAHFHWMRERIYTPATWRTLAAACAVHGLRLWGEVDWRYRGDQVYDYSFLSLCLRKA